MYYSEIGKALKMGFRAGGKINFSFYNLKKPFTQYGLQRKMLIKIEQKTYNFLLDCQELRWWRWHKIREVVVLWD